MTAGSPFNYRYFIDHAAKVGGKSLDYGCGYGTTVHLGRQHGLDIWGADTFSGNYARWLAAVPQEVQDRVRKIENGRADYPDGHFDLVFSNQVLEHVTDPEAVVADMCRLVKPGGVFISAFPVTETWYEGHIGLYFVHRFPKGSQLRQRYFDLCHRMGFGIHRGKHSRETWVERSGRTLDDVCFYYDHARMMRAVENAFGAPVEDISVHYMRTRLGERAASVPALADPLLRFVYHKRAGEIWRVRKPG